jgi:hypothetical protein
VRWIRKRARQPIASSREREDVRVSRSEYDLITSMSSDVCYVGDKVVGVSTKGRDIKRFGAARRPGGEPATTGTGNTHAPAGLRERAACGERASRATILHD